jgi:hypothetical protein
MSPALVMQVVATFAWLLVGAMARPGAAQEPVPTAPAPAFADLVPTVEAVPPTGAVPSYYAGQASAPTAPRVVTGPFDTIVESILGQPDPNSWRPLPLSTLFSEGWNEPWLPSPNGSGGAPRQGWINAADGNFYRLGCFTFAQAFNQGNKSNAYLGAYTLYTPLSRRRREGSTPTGLDRRPRAPQESRNDPVPSNHPCQYYTGDFDFETSSRDPDRPSEAGFRVVSGGSHQTAGTPSMSG